MQSDDFLPTAPGRLVAIAGGARAFVPDPLPRSLPLGTRAVRLVGEARAAVGRLEAGIGALPSAELLLRPLRTNEAVASNRIEGTRTTLEDALADAATGRPSDYDARSVRNYGVALEQGLSALAAGRPITPALIKALQATFLRDDPRFQQLGGRFRDVQAAIGPAACAHDLRLARFIPPPPEHIDACMEDLAKFLADKEENEPLVRVALAHYQFEAVHPFGDGNGRVGRVLIALQMVAEGAITRPWVYLSPEIEVRSREYMDRLYAVSTKGDFAGWIEFFLDVVLASANAALRKLDAIRELEQDYRQRLAHCHTQRPTEAIRVLLEFPVTTIPEIAAKLETSAQVARNTVSELQRTGILAPLETSLRIRGARGRPPRLYICRDLVSIIRRT